MTQNLPPPIPSLIPETAPFSEEQRIWLNGFFAGLVSLDGFGVTPLSGEQAAALISGATASRPMTMMTGARSGTTKHYRWPSE